MEQLLGICIWKGVPSDLQEKGNKEKGTSCYARPFLKYPNTEDSKTLHA